MRGIKGRTAVLTGAARLSGLGHAFCKGLASHGANIVVADVLDGGEAVAKIKESGGKAIFVPCDVSKPEDVSRLQEAVEREFGGCDILVHGAAYFPIHMLEDISIEEWRKVLSVNLDGMFLLARAFVPGMKARGWGRIIPISSTTFHAGSAQFLHYVSTKAGLIGFTRSLARQVGPFGVTVNSIAPGLVRTEGASSTLPPGVDVYEIVRHQQCIPQTLVPENLVGPLLFLASDESAFVTGQTLLVDGGGNHGV